MMKKLMNLMNSKDPQKNISIIFSKTRQHNEIIPWLFNLEIPLTQCEFQIKNKEVYFRELKNQIKKLMKMIIQLRKPKPLLLSLIKMSIQLSNRTNEEKTKVDQIILSFLNKNK